MGFGHVTNALIGVGMVAEVFQSVRAPGFMSSNPYP